MPAKSFRSPPFAFTIANMPWLTTQRAPGLGGRFCRLRCALTALSAAFGMAAAGDLADSARPKSAPDHHNVARPGEPFPGGRFTLERGDVVAFIGGADVEAAQHGG